MCSLTFEYFYVGPRALVRLMDPVGFLKLEYIYVGPSAAVRLMGVVGLLKTIVYPCRASGHGLGFLN